MTVASFVFILLITKLKPSLRMASARGKFVLYSVPPAESISTRNNSF